MDSRSAFIIEELFRLGPMSNQDLAKHMNLSPASITHILQPMVFNGLLRERPPEDYPDHVLASAADSEIKIRRKITVVPNADYGYVLAIDLTGEQAQFHKIDFNLKLEADFIFNLPLILEADVLDQIAHCVKSIASKDKRRLLAIGLTIESCPKPESPLSKGSLNNRALADTASELAKMIQLPVIMTPVDRALTIHEHYAGKARLLEDFFVLHIHESASMGQYSQGQLQNLPTSKQAAPGHWIVDPNGPQIANSPRGSFESYVSRTAIAEQLRIAGYTVQDQEIYQVLKNEHDKNPAAGTILDKISSVTAWLCTNLMHVLCPEKIYITGPLAELGFPFLSRVQKGIRDLTLPKVGQRLSESIELSSDWKRSMAIGTAHQVITGYINLLQKMH